MGSMAQSYPSAATICPALKSFDLYCWRPDPTLSDDENFLDIVLLLTRSSTCKTSGRVACILVDTTLMTQPSVENGRNLDGDQVESVEDLERRVFGSIIGAATNAPLFAPTDSDIHAEISCLGQACNNRRSVRGCTVYITIHPCKRCFAALVAFGVGRVVSRQMPPKQIVDCAHRNGIEVAELTRDMNRCQMKRINELVSTANGLGKETDGEEKACRTDEELMEYVARRKKWREQKRQEKKDAKSKIETETNDND